MINEEHIHQNEKKNLATINHSRNITRFAPCDPNVNDIFPYGRTSETGHSTNTVNNEWVHALGLWLIVPQ